jgi:DNA-directed RNA polymerase subunit M/transcription elongation factor TFIIS
MNCPDCGTLMLLLTEEGPYAVVYRCPACYPEEPD